MQLDMFSQDKSKGYKCECCGQFVKIYRRKLNSSMACVLVLMMKSGKQDFFHVENWLKEIGKPFLRADYHKLRFWRLIEAKIADRIDTSSRNGYYKITGLGCMFAEGKITAKEKAIIYNNELKGFEGKEITIQDALGTKFNYETLMSQ